MLILKDDNSYLDGFSYIEYSPQVLKKNSYGDEYWETISSCPTRSLASALVSIANFIEKSHHGSILSSRIVKYSVIVSDKEILDYEKIDFSKL